MARDFFERVSNFFLSLYYGEYKHYFKSISVVLVYLISAILFLKIAKINSNTSPLWPPSGIAIAALYFWGNSYVAAISLGAFLANFLIGTPASASVLIAFGNTMEAFVGSILLSQIIKRVNLYEYTLGAAILISSLASSLISASFGIWALVIHKIINSNDVILDSWLTWWLGDSLGAITVLLFCFFVKNNVVNFKKNLKDAFFTMAIGIFLGGIIFHSAPLEWLYFCVFPYLFLATFIGNTIGNLTSLIFIIFFYTVNPSLSGFFNAHPEIGQSGVLLQLFLLGCSLCALAFESFRKVCDLSKIVLVLLSTWISCVVAFEYMIILSDKEMEEDLKNVSLMAVKLINDHMAKEMMMLKSFSASFNLNQKYSIDEWNEYFSQLKDLIDVQGVFGVGFVTKVKKTEVPTFISNQVKIGNKFIKYKELVPNLNKNEAYIITYVHPLEINRKAIGLDLNSEKTRSLAAQTSFEKRSLIISGPIKLVQDIKERSGALVFYPIFKNQIHLGWTYSPIVFEDFFKIAFKNRIFEDYSYQIIDKQANVIVADKDNIKNENLIYNTKTIKLAGREYILKLATRNIVHFTNEKYLIFIAVFGVFLSLVFGSFVANLYSVNSRAEVIAGHLASDIKNKEKMLRAQNDFVKSILDNIPSMVTVKSFNENMKYKFFNKAAEQILNVNASKILEKSDYDLFPKEFADKMKWKENLIFDNKQPVKFDEIIKVAGKDVYLRTYKVPLYDSNGRPEFLIGISDDLTDEIRTQKELDVEKAKSIQSSKLASLGEMAAGMAHEINNPLAIIDGNIQLLEKFKDNKEKFDEKVKTILKSVERISKIVKGLKKFSRTSEGQNKKFNLMNNIVNEAVAIVEHNMNRHGVTFYKEIETQSSILCDDVEIEQVVINLLNNAVDAVKKSKGPWVKLVAFDQQDFVILRVIDSGTGIPTDLEEKLFSPFFTTKPVGEGTGLGLSITKGILDNHHATIFVNREFQNTCFEIKFKRGIDLKNAA